MNPERYESGPESKEETLHPNTLNPKLFVSCRRVIPRIHIAQVLPRSRFTQDAGVY